MNERVERISKLIIESGKSYQELEKLTGIQKSSLHRYASGVTEKIPISAIEKIAEAFSVSESYILWGDEIVPSSKINFSKNLRSYMERKGITQKELAEVIGVSAPTVNEWIKAKKHPRIDKIEKLAHYFGCRKSDLIEENPHEQNVGEKILMRRLELGWSQRELATKMGYNHSTITRIEKGIIDIPQSRIMQFSDVLGVSVSWLMGFEDAQEVNETLADVINKLREDTELLQMIKIFANLNTEKKAVVMSVIHALE